MLKQFLNLKLTQKLSPQQIQLMKLIQLPTQAFEQRLLEEMNENPALEAGKEEEEYVKDEFESEELVAFKKQLEPKIDSIDSIDSIKRVVGSDTLIAVCLTVGGCILYSYLNGTFSKYNVGGKRRNKKRTLRRKYK